MPSIFHKHYPDIGSRPGTLAIPQGSPAPRVRVVEFDADSIDNRDITDPDELKPLTASNRTVWIDVQGLGDESLLRGIERVLELHPIVLENAVNIPQRAKSELHDDYQLVVARVPVVDEESDELETRQVCFVIGENWLLSFQERYFGFFDSIRARLEAGNHRIRTLGSGYLAYALLDVMIDHYYPVAEALAHELGELEDEIMNDPMPQSLARLHVIRRQLLIIRRIGWPQREALHGMFRGKSPFLHDETLVFLKETHEHISQITELVDSSHEMAVGLTELYMSTISHRTNEIMKVLTLMASIFIPLTFIAGIYGMNFEYMPELSWWPAYYLVWAAMLSVGFGMVAYFWRRGWFR